MEHWIGLTDLRIGNFEIFFRNSLFVATIITVLVLFTSALAGYVFAKYRFKGRNLLFLAVLSMMMILFNISIIPLFVLMVDVGWSNTYWDLIIPSAFSPFGIFLMNQFMHSIPNELIDAFRIDGASEFRIFFRIIMPLSTAPLAALGIFTFVFQWDDFLWLLVIIDEPDSPVHLAARVVSISWPRWDKRWWFGRGLDAGRGTRIDCLFSGPASFHRRDILNGSQGLETGIK